MSSTEPLHVEANPLGIDPARPNHDLRQYSVKSPLHVTVARALGWTDLHSEESHWWGVEPGGLKLKVPRYDSSWCSAGPLSERLKIGVMWDHGQWIATVLTDEGHDQYAGGERPTEAISRLVVHLHKNGLLTE